ncbi:hypothetical protein M9H77_02706 [Catharanthus roseus]|uniref:Uncharacterized protein n=1 Tax=Catharanthus roseus TaxID=4058 RepID=A0ACC0C9N4_CATRO|nr:hypothetical protein M9H77_02706 [Catharanthus roseus]
MHSQEKDTRCFNRSTSKSVWHNLKKTARSFQSQLSIMERHLRNIGRRLEQREYMHAMVDTMDIKHILKRRILITKLDRVFGIEMKSSQSYTFLEYPLILGDATDDHSCDNSLYDSRMNDYCSYVANVDSFVLGVENKEEHMLGVLENKGKSLKKGLLNLQEEPTMSFSLNPSPLYCEFSFKELNLLSESHSFHHLPFKEFFEKVVFEEWLANKLHALVFLSCLILEYFGHFHSIASFNASISNVARLLWLLERMD